VRRITFAAPRIKRYETDDFQPSGEPRFIAISLRGMECHLMCSHCVTRMLTALHRAETPERLLHLCERMHGRGCRGLLLTGGCDAEGKIPLPEFVDAVREVKRRWGFRIAVHTKLVDEEFVNAAADIGTDLLMLDIVGEERSMREVYHLWGHSPRDIEAGLDLAEARGVPLAPHIMIGIANGQVVGERRALEMLRGRRLAAVVLVVLSPLRNTPMADVKIDIDAALEVMTEARHLFPDTRLTLGCAKTGGEGQRRLEEHAIDLAFDAIAYPSEGIVTLARERGFDVQFSEACCAFHELM
jgi:lipoyl synthase